jgi:hypothetical protein
MILSQVWWAGMGGGRKSFAVFTVGYLIEEKVVAAFVDGVGVGFGCKWPIRDIVGCEGHFERVA